MCSSVENISYSLSEGAIHHGSFQPSISAISFHGIFTTIIDNLAQVYPHSYVSLLHVDVEGKKPDVIKGELPTINDSFPLVLIKNHL